jgi:hypothetical protein
MLSVPNFRGKERTATSDGHASSKGVEEEYAPGRMNTVETRVMDFVRECVREDFESYFGVMNAKIGGL